MPVNVTDRIIILEQDKAKLSLAIHEAVTSVLEKYRQAYLPDIARIPVAGAKINVDDSLSANEKKSCRARIRLCQVLEHYQMQTLDSEFLIALEVYLREPNMKGQVPSINDPAVGEGLKLVQTYKIHNDLMRLPARMIFLKLVSMRILLLPLFGVPTFIPETFGPEDRQYLLELLHPALREMILTLRPSIGITTRIDWTLTKNSMATNSLADVGSDYKDWNPGESYPPLPAYAMSVGVATTWHDIADVTKEELKELHYKASTIGSGNRAIKLYLNCLYLCSESNESRDAFFRVIGSISYYRIYTLEYKIWAKRHSAQQIRAGAAKKSDHATYDQLAHKLRNPSRDYIQGKLDDHGFVASIKNVSGCRLIMDFDKFPSNGPVPLEHSFDWHVKMKQWNAAFSIFKEFKAYENESSSISPFTSFFLYLSVYLPAWFLKNPDSGLEFPEKLPDFKGAIFVHRPESIPLTEVNNPPLTFRQFNEIYNDGNNKETTAKCVRVVKDFFNEIIPSAELLGIPHNWPNPVKNSAVPAGGGRPWGCTKADIPIPVTFLTLLYCYRLLDCMYKVNEVLLSGENMILSNQIYRFAANSRNRKEGKSTLIDLNDLEGFNLDTSATFDGTKLNFNIIPKRLFTPRIFPIKGRGEVYLLDTGPLEQIIVMFETGLRGQSVQWLDTKFDEHIKADSIAEDGIYAMRVNTDKVKESAWPAYVAGRVINVLRKRRDFRKTLDGEIFDQDIYYEGNPDSKWGKFKPVFSRNIENGFPHSDSAYSEHFKDIFHALQGYIDELGINFVSSVPDNTKECGYTVDVTPHSARKAVIREHITYLPAEYIGKYITGQTVRSVGYYCANNPNSFERVERHQKGVGVVDRMAQTVDTSRGPEVTEPHRLNSTLAQAFSANAKQAMHDFASMSTAIFEQESTGSDILREGRHQKLTFEATHICPFGSVCPPERKKQGLVRRCNFCDFAVRTVDNLPAIASEMRNLSEKCYEISTRLDKSGKRMSDAQRSELETQRREIGEDLFSLMVADYVLRESLIHLKDEYRNNPEYFCFTPEIIIKNLEAAPFPLRDEGLKYVLSRLNESKTYISLNDRLIKANIAKFARRFMNRSEDLCDLFIDEDLDQQAAEVYSFVHNYRSAHNLTLDELVAILNKDIKEISGPGIFMLPEISSLIGGNEICISP